MKWWYNFFVFLCSLFFDETFEYWANLHGISFYSVYIVYIMALSKKDKGKSFVDHPYMYIYMYFHPQMVVIIYVHYRHHCSMIHLHIVISSRILYVFIIIWIYHVNGFSQKRYSSNMKVMESYFTFFNPFILWWPRIDFREAWAMEYLVMPFTN